MEELETAGNRLRAALDEYPRVCSRMDDQLCHDGIPHNLPLPCSNLIDSEIAHFPSYGANIGRAEATVCGIRNHSSQLTPITSLPPEILTYIFHVVTEPCDLLDFQLGHSDNDTSSRSSEDSDGDLEKHYRHSKLDNFPTHLDQLTHVCSDWRQVAIGSPSLWTHIDLIPHKTLHNGLLARAETYAVRSSGLPLELHVSDIRPFPYYCPDFSGFLCSILNRIESLDFVVLHTWRRFHHIILRDIFSSNTSQPSALIKIKTSFPRAGKKVNEFLNYFDKTSGDHLCFTMLHLQGLFPTWQSTAYHNLVDLRLIAARDEYWTEIPELSLRNILASSPGLRIFHFSLDITKQQSDDTLVVPVSLNDLEVLRITTYRELERRLLTPGDVLRLIAPGSKPLRLSICHSIVPGYDDDSSIFQAALLKFFQRSNISKFHAEYSCPQLDRLVLYAPDIKDLILDACVSGFDDIGSLGGGTPLPSRLSSLTLLSCFPSLEQLELLLRQHPTDLLLLCKCKWKYIGDSSEDRDPVGRIMELLERYPTTKLIMGASNPVANWDLIV